MSGDLVPKRENLPVSPYSGAAQAAPPPAARTLNKAMNRNLLTGVGLIFVLVFGMGGAAAFVDVSGAVVAQGELATASDLQNIQHPGGGVVSEILVKDGQRVSAGDVLIRFDPTAVGASFTIVSDAATSLSAKMARLAAERGGLADITFPPELLARQADPSVAAVIANERNLFALHTTARNSTHAQQHEQQGQAQQKIRGFQDQITAKQRQLDLIQPEIAAVHSLYDRQLATLSRVNELERTDADLRGAIGQLNASIAEARGQISEIDLQMSRLDQQESAQAGADYSDAASKLAEFQQREVAARQDYDRLAVRAPWSGVVDKLAVHTIGAVIAPGDVIMVIVPDDGRLTVEVKTRPSDIEQLYVGQPARLRFSALNSRTTPEIGGKVTRVGADATTEQRTGARYYIVAIDVPAAEVAKLGGARLRPGMPVEAFISTRNRTMLSFLTKPMADQLRRAFREE